VLWAGHSIAKDYRAHLPFSDPLRWAGEFGHACHASPPPFRSHAEAVRIGKLLQEYQRDPKLRNKNHYEKYGACLKKEMSRSGISGFSSLAHLYRFNVIWDILPDMMHNLNDVAAFMQYILHVSVYHA
jgi:hypothetical protein